MAGDSRHERPVRRGKVDDTGGDVEGGDKLYYHLTLLAETTQGYRNLMKLSSAAYLEGYYYKPRVDWELLERHSTGLIATTGCLGGVVLQALLAGDDEKALKLAGRLQDIFGRDGLFVELQDHGLAAQSRTNPALIRIARQLDAPLIATNDSHYTHREDAVAHDALLCVQTGALIDDPKRFKFEGEEHYLKSAAEMRSLFAEVPEACDSTLLIAERANVEIEFGLNALPEFPVPAEFTGRRLRRAGRRLPPSLGLRRGPQALRDPLGPGGGRTDSTTSWVSSPTWGSPPTSSSSGTSFISPARAASGSAPVGVRPPGAAWPTASRSSIWTPSATTFCSSVS